MLRIRDARPPRAPLLSAAMIVRNEAKNLRACLDSIKSQVDEIVIIDTGSTDDTIAIARSFGAVVHQHPWRDDFSFHRNQSIDYARGTWLLVIDGDEVLTQPAALRETVESIPPEAETDALMVRIDCISEQGVVERYFSPRVFRRDRGRYRYAVHNQLVGCDHAATCAAVIEASYRSTTAAKAARSIPMLERLAGDPATEAHAAYFLAKTYLAVGDLEQAWSWTLRCRELVPDVPGYASFWLWTFELTLLRNGLEAAEAVLDEAIRYHPGFSELRHYQVALAASHWCSTVASPGPYAGVSAMSWRFIDQLPGAAAALGLPVMFSRTSCHDALSVENEANLNSHRQNHLTCGPTITNMADDRDKDS